MGILLTDEEILGAIAEGVEVKDGVEMRVVHAKSIAKAQLKKVVGEIKKLFADEDGTHTFIRSRDGKAGVEDCKLIITKEWQALLKEVE